MHFPVMTRDVKFPGPFNIRELACSISGKRVHISVFNLLKAQQPVLFFHISCQILVNLYRKTIFYIDKDKTKWRIENWSINKAPLPQRPHEQLNSKKCQHPFISQTNGRMKKRKRLLLLIFQGTFHISKFFFDQTVPEKVLDNLKTGVG